MNRLTVITPTSTWDRRRPSRRTWIWAHRLSIAAHFQVFQLGADGFDDAVNELTSILKERDLKP